MNIGRYYCWPNLWYLLEWKCNEDNLNKQMDMMIDLIEQKEVLQNKIKLTARKTCR